MGPRWGGLNSRLGYMVVAAPTRRLKSSRALGLFCLYGVSFSSGRYLCHKKLACSAHTWATKIASPSVKPASGRGVSLAAAVRDLGRGCELYGRTVFAVKVGKNRARGALRPRLLLRPHLGDIDRVSECKPAGALDKCTRDSFHYRQCKPPMLCVQTSFKEARKASKRYLQVSRIQ